jgi:hypothetical protein
MKLRYLSHERHSGQTFLNIQTRSWYWPFWQLRRLIRKDGHPSRCVYHTPHEFWFGLDGRQVSCDLDRELSRMVVAQEAEAALLDHQEAEAALLDHQLRDDSNVVDLESWRRAK